MNLPKSERSSKKLYTGFFGAKVVAVNPTKSELAELLGYEPSEDSKEISYDGKTDKGDDYVTLSFWLKADHPDQPFFNAKFRIVNKELVSEKSGKSQFVNQVGMSTWAMGEKVLPTWFTNFTDKNKTSIGIKEVRPSLQGEADLYEFLTCWFGGVDFFNPEANIFINVKKLFQDVDGYVEKTYKPYIKAQLALDREKDPDTRRELMKVMITANVVGLATVYITEKEDGIKMYQNLYKKFFRDSMMKKIRLAVTQELWDAEKGADKSLSYFYAQIHGEHGCKDAFKLQMLDVFNPEEHDQASSSTILGSTSASNDSEIDF